MCDDYCCNHGCNQGRDCPARHKPADELQRLQGEARGMRGLLRLCAEVLCTINPESDTEGEELYALLHAIQGVIEPKAKGALL